MKKMLAAQFLAPDRIEAIEVGVPELRDGEALVRVEACGICGSDLFIVSGGHPRARPPLTIGHEFCGRVVEVAGADQEIAPGDRVTLYPLISCGECFVCKNGQPHVCRSLGLYGFDDEGGMADFVRVPVTSLMKIPETMSGQAGALLEPLAVGVHAVARSPVKQDDMAIVIGAGPIGLVTALALRHHGVERIRVTDLNPFRLQLARELGFNALDGARDDLLEIIYSETNGEGADVVFEVAGAPASALQMTELVRCRGTVVNVSVFKTPVEVRLQSVNFKELTIIGSRVYTPADFLKAIEAVEGLPIEKLITHSFPLQDVAEAFQIFKSGGDVCKVLVKP